MPSLREQSILDARDILADVEAFAAALVIVAPTGEEHEVRGMLTETGRTVDPETGAAVIAQTAMAVLSSDELPDGVRAVEESSGAPWLLRFGGRSYRISGRAHDRTLDVVELWLTEWR